MQNLPRPAVSSETETKTTNKLQTMSSTSGPAGPSRPARHGIFARIKGLRSRSRSRGHPDTACALTDAAGTSSLLGCPDP